MESPHLRVATERRQYLGEIRTAKQIGDHQARKQLVLDYLEERNALIRDFYTESYGARFK